MLLPWNPARQWRRIARQVGWLFLWRRLPFGISRLLVLAFLLLCVLVYQDVVDTDALVVGVIFFFLAASALQLDRRQFITRLQRLSRSQKDLSHQLTRADLKINEYVEVFESLHDAIMLLDKNLEIVMASRSARSLFPSVLPGVSFSNAVRHPLANAAVEKAVSQERVIQQDYRVSAPVDRELSLQARPFLTKSKVFYILVVIKDRSEELKLSQLRTDFIANASHELKTPLTGLIACLETLEPYVHDFGEDSVERKFFDMARGQANRMHELITDLLSLSHVELQEHRHPEDIIDLKGIIEEVAHHLSDKAERSNIKIYCQLDQALFMRGDERQLHQVFTNLIENAIKYGRDEGSVTVQIAQVQPPRVGMFGISVTDDGIGIARMDVPRLTERFYRVDHARSGTGLGLAIVKHIINRHGGMLTIGSEPGRGSVFTVWFHQVDRLSEAN